MYIITYKCVQPQHSFIKILPDLSRFFCFLFLPYFHKPFFFLPFIIPFSFSFFFHNFLPSFSLKLTPSTFFSPNNSQNFFSLLLSLSLSLSLSVSHSFFSFIISSFLQTSHS